MTEREEIDIDLLPAEALTREQLEERMRRVGIRPSTKSLRRERVAVPQRPKWLAFIIRTLKLEAM